MYQSLSLCLGLLVKVSARHVHCVQSHTLTCEVAVVLDRFLKLLVSLQLALPLCICLGKYVILRHKFRYLCAKLLNNMVFFLL